MLARGEPLAGYTSSMSMSKPIFTRVSMLGNSRLVLFSIKKMLRCPSCCMINPLNSVPDRKDAT